MFKKNNVFFKKIFLIAMVFFISQYFGTITLCGENDNNKVIFESNIKWHAMKLFYKHAQKPLPSLLEKTICTVVLNTNIKDFANVGDTVYSVKIFGIDSTLLGDVLVTSDSMKTYWVEPKIDSVKNNK